MAAKEATWKELMANEPQEKGFTLVEVMLTLLVLFVSVTAILSTQHGLSQMGSFARNLSLANIDVQRVIEQIRINSNSCSGTPRAVSPVGTSWDAWLDTLEAANPLGGGSKSLPAVMNERIYVSCRSENNAVPCSLDQLGAGEWQQTLPMPAAPPANPIRITVSVCWNDRGRVIGQCRLDNSNPPVIIQDDSLTYASNVPNVIDSIASATTLIACNN